MTDVEREDPGTPRWSSTSVKPPVEAPTSSATRSPTVTPNASRAPISLCAPRLTYGSFVTTSTAEAGVDEVTGLPIEPGAVTLTDPHPTGQDEGLGAHQAFSTRPRSTSSWSRRWRLVLVTHRS